jgi:hypothetical protein
LAQTFSQDHPDLAATCQIIIDVVGVIGVIIIVIMIIAALPMIPDFIRYLKLKSM